MLERFTNSLSTKVVLASMVLALFSMLTASSALATRGVRPATGRAAHRVSHRSRRDRTHGSATSARSHHRTHTNPAKPVSPVGPVSPVEPTPPIVIVTPAPVETVPPIVPVESTPPVTPVEPTPAPPTASFTFAPASPVTGRAVSFDGASSSCSDGPCTYTWSDDGGTTRPIPALWPLGSGQTLSFTFLEVGTKYVRLVVTDAAGQTATVEHNVVVAAPVQEEKAKEEKAKEEKSQEEKAKEEKAKEVKSQEEKAKEEKAKEEKAKEVKSQEEKAKEEKAKEEKAKEEKTTGTPENCFENPETEGTMRFEACGYPGPKNTGVEEVGGRTECAALPEYTGSRSIGTAKTTIEGKLVKIDLGSGESGFDVNAAEVTFNKDCLLVTGDGREGPVIKQDEHGANLLIENSTIRSEGPKLPYSYEKAVDNNYGISAGWKISNSRIEDCGECVSGFGAVTKSYVISNEYVGEESHGLHREDWYLNDETASVRESTMFNPSDQTSDIFMDSNNGSGRIACVDKLTVEKSLLAGGGTSIEMCGKEDTKGTSSFTFVDNRIPRCETTPIVKNSGGEEDCSGPYFEGGDAHGYMPHGGADGLAAFEDVGSVTWSGNYWDNSLEPVLE
jgi:hypothetical protein